MTVANCSTSVPPVPPMRVAVVNEYQQVVEGVAALLGPHSDRVVVVELDREAPGAHDVDVVLCDTCGHNQGSAIDPAVLRSLSASSSVVVFTRNIAPAVVEQIREAAAVGIVSKGTSAAELVEALGQGRAGERLFPTE